MTTDQKGAIAEMAIALAALKLGIEVYRPLAEGGRYDLILEVREKLWRVQCKWACRYEDVVVVRCYSNRRAREGLRRRRYTPDEIDAFAAYCLELDRCFFIPNRGCADERVATASFADEEQSATEGQMGGRLRFRG